MEEIVIKLRSNWEPINFYIVYQFSPKLIIELNGVTWTNNGKFKESNLKTKKWSSAFLFATEISEKN